MQIFKKEEKGNVCETSSPKHHGVHFVLTTTRGRVIPLVNTDFPFPNKYQLQMPSWVAVGLCVHFLFLVLGFFLVHACWSCTCCLCLWELMLSVILCCSALIRESSCREWGLTQRQITGQDTERDFGALSPKRMSLSNLSPWGSGI